MSTPKQLVAEAHRLHYINDTFIKQLAAALETTIGQAEFYLNAAVRAENEVHDVLAEALGYPVYAPGEPGYSDQQVNFITGDHTAASLAAEAAARLRETKGAS